MRQYTNRKIGFTLVEVMISILLLLIMVLGGSAVMYQTGGGIQRQQNKREAVVAANSVLEGYWNTTYDDLGKLAGTPISTNVAVNGQDRTATIEISTEQNDGDGGKYYELQVSVPWMDGETVDLVSRRYERGLSKARAN